MPIPPKPKPPKTLAERAASSRSKTAANKMVVGRQQPMPPLKKIRSAQVPKPSQVSKSTQKARKV